MYSNIFLVAVLAIHFICANELIAQDGCPEVTDKKVLALFKKGTDKKKYKKPERLKFLQEAVEEEEDFIQAHYILGKEIVRTAKYNGTSYKAAEPHLLKVIELCPIYHSDPYYWLAEMYYDQNDFKKAVKYYKEFMDFQSEDKKKFARDYDTKYESAKEDAKYANFYHEKYTHPVPFEPVVVDKLSTKNGEYLPLISPDNQLIFFTRRKPKSKKTRDSVFESHSIIYEEKFEKAHREGAQFDMGMPMSAPFNTVGKYNYGGATVTIDNKHLFITICKPGKGGYVNCDIYSTDFIYAYNEYFKEETWFWTDLKNLGPNINSEESWEAQPSISADGKTLYFASAREDSKGIDIYYSELDENGEWGKAQNMGEPVNSEANDKSPFIHSDSETLYFSSNGHTGFGGMDVFYVRKNSRGKWEEPENMGYPINTQADEHSFVVSTDGKTVYFASDQIGEQRSTTGLDIYSFELYKEARPQKVLFMKGEIRDEQGEIVADAVVEAKNSKTQEVHQFKVDENDGKYAAVITLKEGEDVLVNVKSETHETAFNTRMFTYEDYGKEQLSKSVPMDTVAVKKEAISEEDQHIEPDVHRLDNTYVDLDLKIEEVTEGKAYRLHDIHYESNSAELSPETKNLLDEFIAFLMDKEELEIAIHGHTDNLGSHDDNMHLSHDRSFSVMEYLQAGGINKSRLSFHGYGETKPVDTNDTPEGRAKNRRTEFVVTGM